MATSSGNISGSSQMQNSGSEEELQHMMMNERKRKRMQSNRESARRSRMRKQKHLDDLMGQVAQLRKENNQILTSINITTEHYLNVEAENSVLSAQMMELSQRLQSLNEMLSYMTTTTTTNSINNGVLETDQERHTGGADGLMMMMMNSNPWNLMYLNQPAIMASADMF